MALAHPLIYFTAFRFFVVFGPGARADTIVRLGGRSIGLMAVWSDPFAPDRLWIAKGHAKGEKTLRELLDAETTEHTLAVFMTERDGTPERRIDVTFERFDWLPFDLDATKEETAVEWVALRGVTYGPPVNETEPHPE